MSSKKIISSWLIIIILVILDQITKIFFINYFKNGGENINILPFLDLIYVWNKGISFGMFAQVKYSNYIFMAFASIVTFFVVYLKYTSTKTLEIAAYSLIIGGAVGNLIDRILYGAVFDFIYFHIIDFHWPAFNCADSFISIGVALFVINLIFYEKRRKVI